MSHKKVA